METMETVLDAPCRTTRWAPEKVSVAGLPLRTVLLSRLQRIEAGQVGDDEVIERIISCQKMINMLQGQLISEQAEFARRRLERRGESTTRGRRSSCAAPPTSTRPRPPPSSGKPENR